MELDELAMYTALALEARRLLIKELLDKEVRIRANMRNIVKEIAKEIKANPNMLERIEDHLRNKEEIIRESLRKEIDSGLKLSIEAGMHESRETTLSILNKADINWKPIERSYFRVHNEAVDYMYERNIKGLNLSDRIWANSWRVRYSLGEIIEEAIREGLNPTDIAELLERYANDGAKTFAVQYPNMFERLTVPMDMNYESLRLARTEMAAAFGHASVESAKINPSTQGIKWSISNAGVTCDVCLEISEKDNGMGKGVYEVDKLPDYPAHPNCLCVLSEVTENIDDLVDRLVEWNKNPLSQPDLERWYQNIYKLGEVS